MKPQPVRLGNLSVGFVHSMARAMLTLGHDPAALLLQYGLDPARMAEPHARLSIPRFMRLGHAAIQLTGEPGLGLWIGRLNRFNQLGLAGVTAAQAPTVREAARTLIRFEPLYASNYRGQSSFHEDARGAWLRFYSISPYNAYNRFVVDSVMASWHSQLGLLAGCPLQPEKVEIEYPGPAYADQHSALFGCPVAFGASHNQIRLNQTDLARRNPEHCPGTWRELLGLCEQRLEELPRTRSLAERISRLLGPLLRGSEPDFSEVAARLNMPAWTLRRKLAEEGTGYREILNNTRRDLAMSYIRDTELAFGEIAFLLGFTSAEAFQRAFKRWSGQPPGDFRRARRQSS